MGSVRNFIDTIQKVAQLSEDLDVFSSDELDTLLNMAKTAQQNPYYNAGQSAGNWLQGAANWVGNAANDAARWTGQAATDVGNFMAPGMGAWGLAAGPLGRGAWNAANFASGLFNPNRGQTGGSLGGAVGNAVNNAANQATRQQWNQQHARGGQAQQVKAGPAVAGKVNAQQTKGAPAGKAAAPQKPTGYNVQAGDTLWGLAQQQGIANPQKIQQWVQNTAQRNNIADPNQINVGQTLRGVR